VFRARPRVIGFGRAERGAIEAALERREPPECPRCGIPLVLQPVEPGPGIAYVRHRVLALCSRCGGHASVDTPPAATDER